MSINPRVEVLLSRVLAALRPVLIAYMVTNAMTLAPGVEDALSFCNVLFVGNLCAALVLITWFRPGPIFSDLRQLPRMIQLTLLIDGGLAALTSGLIFTGLTYTSSTNAILLGRLAPVLYALSGALIFGRMIARQEWFGFSFIIAGTLVVALIGGDGTINKGDALILASTVVFAISSILGKAVLNQNVTLKSLVFIRNASSSIIFFIIANIVYGPHHFADAFYGRLWILMGIYALIVIVIAQLLWFDATHKLDSISLGRWATPAPAIGVLAAGLLNRQWPSDSQVSGLIIIMIGVVITALSPSTKQQPSQNKQRIAELTLNASDAASPVT